MFALWSASVWVCRWRWFGRRVEGVERTKSSLVALAKRWCRSGICSLDLDDRGPVVASWEVVTSDS